MATGKETASDAAREKPTCYICEKEFKSKNEWSKHTCTLDGSDHSQVLRQRIAEELEMTEKPFICSHCSKRFAQRAFLTIHLRTHTDERPFDCKTCGKAFHQRSHLRYHLLTHTTKCTYTCHICNKKLRYKQSLQLHLRIHKQEKNFVCDICGKAFYEKPKLKIHLRIHTGEKPYTCNICGRGFAQKGNCDKHVDRYHARDKERKFPCHICSKSFIWKKCLDMHLAEHKLDDENIQNMKKNVGLTDDLVKKNIMQKDPPKEIEVLDNAESYTILEEAQAYPNHAQDIDGIDDITIIEHPEEAEINEVTDKPKGAIVLDETIAKVANVNLGLPMLDPNIGVKSVENLNNLYFNGNDIIVKKKKRRPRQKTLRENMNKLLPVLLDDEILREIGWPKKPIEIMVMQVLQYCGQEPSVAKSNGTRARPRSKDEDEAFQNNVRLLLNIALEEKFTEVNNVQEKTPNEIMIELLKFCKIT